MKQILLYLAVFSFSLSVHAQKDKTLSWNSPVIISGTVTVTNKSTATGPNYYEMLAIKPYAAKTMKFRVSTNYAGNYIIRISSKVKSFVDQKTSKGNYYVFQLSNLDSVNIMLVAKPTETQPVQFHYSYSIGDTARISLENKSAQEVFEQLLQLAANKFENLYSSSTSGRLPPLEFANGLFFNKYAVVENGYMKQLTGAAQDSKTADKDNAEWNKKIKAWLKPYKVSDVQKMSKEQLIAKSNYLFNEATQYTKKDAKGNILFNVSVYKVEDSEEFYTGVYISNN